MAETIAIIGAGPQGRRLARSAARAGYRVLLEDVMPVNLEHAQEALRLELGPAALPMVTFVSTIDEAVRQADMVIDYVPDELESKLEILLLLDRMAPPRTVLATPTRLSIADLANCTYRPEKVIAIGAHSGAMAEEAERKLEIRTTRRTARETTEIAAAFWRRLGFETVLVREREEAELD